MIKSWVYRYKKFTYGRSISEEKRKLANLNENMMFRGGPKDKHYKNFVFGNKLKLKGKHKGKTIQTDANRNASVKK